jgi:hypothetical protein
MNGGVIAVDKMNGEIAITGDSKITNFKVSNLYRGSLLYSPTEENVLLTIKGSYITCLPHYFVDQATASINT